jgi:hypothetical protein
VTPSKLICGNRRAASPGSSSSIGSRAARIAAADAPRNPSSVRNIQSTPVVRMRPPP